MCLESVQPVAISRCDHLERTDIGTCEMWARAEGTRTISTNAIGRCVAQLCNFCGDAESMCQHDCA